MATIKNKSVAPFVLFLPYCYIDELVLVLNTAHWMLSNDQSINQSIKLCFLWFILLVDYVIDCWLKSSERNWSHKTGLVPPLFIDVHVPIQDSGRSCICVLWLLMLSFSTTFYLGFWNCSDTMVFYVFHFMTQQVSIYLKRYCSAGRNNRSASI
jgi:hypothetical protein